MILDEIVAAWGRRLTAADPIGREVGSRGVISGWRVATVDEAGAPGEHLLYLEDAALEDAAPDTAPTPGTALATAPDGTTRRIWRYPADPGLPALAALVFPDAARVILDRLGVAATITDLGLAAYRPGKRAVVRVSTTDGVLFVKVVPPKLLTGVLARHRAWHDAGMPSPPPVAWSTEGLIVLGALAGRPAIDSLTDVDPRVFAHAIHELRSRIRAVDLDLPARASLGDRLGWYRDRVTGLAPELGAAVARVVEIAQARRSSSTSTSVTVHGDLHLGQLLTDPADPSHLIGILDVDTSGVGDSADDDAALWAHAIVMAERGLLAAAPFAAALQTDWMPHRRDRIASVATALLLGHGLSGHLALERSVTLAAAIADRPDENPLTLVS
jgi:aminoglycoside phosphotransferase